MPLPRRHAEIQEINGELSSHKWLLQSLCQVSPLSVFSQRWHLFFPCELRLSWFFVWLVILDCILDILILLFWTSVYCLHSIENVYIFVLAGFPGIASGKEPTCQCRRPKRNGIDLWARKSPGEGNGNPLQYSSLENPIDGGAWRATVHGVANSQRWLKWAHRHNLGRFRL